MVKDDIVLRFSHNFFFWLPHRLVLLSLVANVNIAFVRVAPALLRLHFFSAVAAERFYGFNIGMPVVVFCNPI